MMTLQQIFGQEAAIGAIRRALAHDCLAGAYLFVGAPGTGKGALADALASAATCTAPVHPFDACGQCGSCRRLRAGTHPEVVRVSPAGEQTQIWQFWTRDNRDTPGVLSTTLCYAPVIGRRRVYILEQADTLTEAAANSLLKVLEEPPPYALFLLRAPHTSHVLPTIVSRCQIVRVHPVPTDRLTDYLAQRFHMPADRAEAIAAYAEGKVGQAVRMAENPAIAAEIARVLDLAEGIPRAPRVRALRLAEQLRQCAAQLRALPGGQADPISGDEGDTAPAKEKASRRTLLGCIDLLVIFYRDLLALSVSGASACVVNRDRVDRLARIAASAGPERWMYCLDALLMARRRLEANANVAMVTEALMMALVGV
ncbi:MAG: hypothetical protein RMJ43_11365 [Chloroherpetonaceae bacterium]|nr:hypothetical protein [Chthonomonadaceae bacterium]MDW8208428.1 hypothetical protein [Chloroherpetonaceae bacterium]